jgi:DNA-binding NarL/FixJ family response regulator
MHLHFQRSIEDVCDKKSFTSLVIVDIRMSRLNRLQLYHRLKAMSISAKVLFVSALDASGELISILPDASDMRFIKKTSRSRTFHGCCKGSTGFSWMNE